MAQDRSQKFFLWGIFLVLGVCVLMWLLQRKCDYCQNKCYECDDKDVETYSPYRRTGGCPPRTGWNYLDAYEQEDYYKNYPYIYPTPTNYTRALYKGRRAEHDFIEARAQQLAREYSAKHQVFS